MQLSLTQVESLWRFVCVCESFEKDDAGQTMGNKALNQDGLCLWECVSGLCYLSVSCLCSHLWLSHTINTDCRFTHSATEAENAHSHLCVCVWGGWQRFTFVLSWVEKRITLDSFPLGMSVRICNHTHTNILHVRCMCVLHRMMESLWVTVIRTALLFTKLICEYTNKSSHKHSRLFSQCLCVWIE